MELKDLLVLIARRWKYGLAAFSVAFGGFVVFWLFKVPSYVGEIGISTERKRVLEPTLQKLIGDQGPARVVSQLEIRDLFEAPALSERTLELLKANPDGAGAKLTPAEIRSRLNFVVSGEPPLYVIEANAPTSREARDLIQAAGTAFNEAVTATIERKLSEADAELRKDLKSNMEKSKAVGETLAGLKAELALKDEDTSVEAAFKRLSAEQAEAKSRTAAAEKEILRLDALLKKAAAGTAIAESESPLSDEIKARNDAITALEIKLRDLRNTYTEENPKIITTNEKIAELKAGLPALRTVACQDALKRNELTRDRARADEGRLAGQIAAVTQRSGELVNAFLEKSNLDRSINALTSTIDDLSLDLSLGGRKHSYIKTAAYVRPATGGRRMTDLWLFLIVSLIVGIAAAYAVEYMDDSIRDPLHVSRYANLDVVASVPRIEEEDVNLADIEGPTPLAEVIGRLAMVFIKLMGAIPGKAVLITSAHPDEGKSILSLNLAVALARLGKRTVLIDADLRRGKLHDLMRVDNSSGLSSLLEGKESARVFLDALQSGGEAASPSAAVPATTGPTPGDLKMGDLRALAKLGVDEFQAAGENVAPPQEDIPRIPQEEIERVMRPTEVANLELIPAGMSPANPGNILESPRMKALMIQLKETHDYIVVDSAPVTMCADPIILAGKVDGTLLAVRVGVTKRSDLKTTKSFLDRSGARLLGAILTFTEARESNYYTYYYAGYKRARRA